ncbi:Hypothetical Protein FCC1311_106312 [Hondaea fermentalgiana]|uniref:Uncharacterized protein n=1 Tax=Hondaea fermentalgiana TaxID=2315210 RepID=A0A2R5GU62_9STRA|nr:Hypothetical Protein FCC1311_106312 [Hondaea fermentalgiana]|eukprot:GBG34407.1 Hypothetical Protein FCC1311_106312 [Hondaea fermentalgiana]
MNRSWTQLRMARNFSSHVNVATTDAGRSNAHAVPKAGQSEGGHPHVMQKNAMGKRIFDLTSRPAFTPLKLIMAGVLAAGAYKLFVMEPSKGEYQFDPRRRESEILENSEAEELKLARSSTWHFGPFSGKNREVLGVMPTDEKLENQQTTHSAAGAIASSEARKEA